MVILPHAIMYAIMFFFTWVIFFLAWSRRRTPGGVFLLCHLVALSIWVFGLYFEAVSTSLNVKILWSQICYLGFTATVPFYLLFVIEYTSQTKVKKYLPIVLFIVPFLTDIAAWTNQWHHLLWSGFYWGSTEYNILVYQHGVLFFLHLIFIYTLAFVGLAILALRILKSQPPFRSQLIILLISGLFPIVSGSLYAFNINPIKGMDISSFGFLLTDISLALGFAHFQLLDLVPVARDTLIKRIQDGMIVLDWKNRIVEINRNALILLNFSEPNPIGRSYQEVIPWPIELEKLSRLNLPVEISLDEDKRHYLELQVSSLTPQSSTPSGYLIILRDISTRKLTELKLKQANEDLQNQIDRINELQIMLQHEATHDSLTGLNNRRLSDEVLNNFLSASKQRNQPFSILVMDIDHFKEINDQFGHQTGDNLLEEYGNAIRLATRKNDYSSRLGGDEILMAFQNMTIEEAAIKAGKIRQKLQMITIEKDGNSISASVSIGIATYPLNGTSVNELISWADRALYAAKDKGRNQVVLASSVSRSPINKGK